MVMRYVTNSTHSSSGFTSSEATRKYIMFCRSCQPPPTSLGEGLTFFSGRATLYVELKLGEIHDT